MGFIQKLKSVFFGAALTAAAAGTMYTVNQLQTTPLKRELPSNEYQMVVTYKDALQNYFGRGNEDKTIFDYYLVANVGINKLLSQNSLSPHEKEDILLAIQKMEEIANSKSFKNKYHLRKLQLAGKEDRQVIHGRPMSDKELRARIEAYETVFALHKKVKELFLQIYFNNTNGH